MLLHINFCHCSVCSISGDYTDLGFIPYKELRVLLITIAVFFSLGGAGSHPKQQQNNQMAHWIVLQTAYCNKKSEKL